MQSAEQNEVPPSTENQNVEQPVEGQIQEEHKENKEEGKADNQMDLEKPKENQPHDLAYTTDLIDKQREVIRKEIEEDSPLISDLLPLDCLEFEFADNYPFLIKIRNLKSKYPDYRKVRRDGSCFYRAFLFKLFEYLIKSGNKAQLDKTIKSIQDSKKYLMDVGFEEFVIEDFQESLLDHLDSIKKNLLSEKDIKDIICDKMKSDIIVLYLRFLVSGYLKTNAILYEHFLENGMTIDQFCQMEVEPIDKDADQIQITALVNYLDIPIKIIYLDGSPREEADELYIPESCNKNEVFITFLYRPGHYDLVYT